MMFMLPWALRFALVLTCVSSIYWLTVLITKFTTSFLEDPEPMASKSVCEYHCEDQYRDPKYEDAKAINEKIIDILKILERQQDNIKKKYKEDPQAIEDLKTIYYDKMAKTNRTANKMGSLFNQIIIRRSNMMKIYAAGEAPGNFGKEMNKQKNCTVHYIPYGGSSHDLTNYQMKQWHHRNKKEGSDCYGDMTNFGCVRDVFSLLALNVGPNLLNFFTSDAGVNPDEDNESDIGQKTIVNVLTIFENSKEMVEATSGVIIKIQHSFVKSFPMVMFASHISSVCEKIRWVWTLNKPLASSPYNSEMYLLMVPEKLYKRDILSPEERTLENLELWAQFRSSKKF